MKKIFEIRYLIFSTFLLGAIGVYGQVQPSVSQGCAPLTVSFSAPYQDVATYQWTFSDGQTANVSNPTIRFDEVGLISLHLKLVYQNGVEEIVEFPDIVNINPLPVAKFEVNQTAVCLNETVNFANKSDGATSYVWNFGDGNQSTAVNTSHNYQSPGTYNVSLKAVSAGGCDNILVKEKIITVSAAAAVDISVSNNYYCIGADSLIFSSTGDEISKPLWDFGDGTTSDLKEAKHKYQSAGSYTVQLSFENSNGCSQSIIYDQQIEVAEMELPKLTISEEEVCVGQLIIAEASELAGASYQWTLNDSRSFTGRKIEIPFLEAGSYELFVQITTSEKCQFTIAAGQKINVKPASVLQLEAASFEGCAPFDFKVINKTEGLVKAEWMVEGRIKKGKELSYLFNRPGTYQIKSISYFENGCVLESMLQEVKVLGEQTVMEVGNTVGCAPLEVSFKLLNNEAKEVKWLLADGTQFSGAAVSHVFEAPGKYKPVVSYINKFGCLQLDSVDHEIEVYDAGIQLGEPDTIQSCTMTEVYFNGAMGYDSWQWDFGDGNTSELQNPIHAYQKPGIYQVSLATTNKNGCQTTINAYNIIEIPDINPTASFTITKGDVCGYFTVELSSQLKKGEQAFWYFEEVLVGTGANVDLSFLSLANLQVVLKIEKAGCSSSKSIGLVNPWADCVNEEVPAAEDTDEATGLAKFNVNGCNTPFVIDFSSPTERPLSVKWIFDDGQIIQKRAFSHTFEQLGVHTVDLSVAVNKDSSYYIKDYITVNISRGVVDFGYEVKALCSGYEVSFSTTEEDLAYRLWKVNNKPMELTDANNSYFFEKAGLYQISLEASGSGMCKATQVKNIFIGNAEHIFEYNASLCLGEKLEVVQHLQGFKEFNWVLNERDTINSTQLIQELNEPGIYTLALIAKSYDDCDYVFQVSDEIEVLNTQASFTTRAKPYGCGNLTVQFVNQSTDGSSYLWDFGNGQTSTALNPQLNYEPGTYTVSLTTTNGSCSDIQVMDNFIVVDELTAAFNYDINQSCLPAKVSFQNESINAAQYLWDFGDGQTSTEENPIHTYEVAPTGPVSLKVINDKGCEIITNKTLSGIFSTDFVASEQDVCLPYSIQFESKIANATDWSWDFGDGETSNEESPLHEFTKAGVFDISLIAKSSEGCVDTLIKTAYINVRALKADFELLEGRAVNCVPSEIKFANSSIGANKFLWDFGDGEQSTVANPVHIYNKVGVFDVKLIVWNEIGCTDTLLMQEMITTSGPEAAFSMEEKVICMPNTANFHDKSADAISWTWYFGDGNISNEQHPRHEYKTAGWYKVLLQVANENGCTQTVKMDSIRVLPTPKVDFQIQTDGSCAPVRLTTVNLSTNLLNPSYTWQIGELVSQEKEPVLELSQPGNFEVTLTITNEGACPISYTYPSRVLVRDTTQHHEANLELISADDYSISFDIEEYGGNNISGYNVYRSSGSGMKLLKTVSLQDFKVFMDEAVKPNEQIYEYIFQAVKYCGDTVSKSQLTTYNNLKLLRQSEGSPRYLSWNKHSGKPINNYRVFLRSDVDTEWTEVAVTDPSIRSFSDSKMLCAGRYYYRVAAFSDNQPVSLSNQIVVDVSLDEIKNLAAEVKNTTVVGKDQVLVEWTVNPFAHSIISHFEVYRSVDQSAFELIGEVRANEQIYIDESVDTDLHEYFYKVQLINNCGIDSKSSNTSSSLLLNKQSRYSDYQLKWNAYTGWDEGVLKYLLQKQNALGEWETIQEIPADQTEVIILRPKE